MSIRQFSPLPPNCVVAVVAVVAGGSQISRKRWRNRNLRNIRQRYLQIVAHYDGYDDRFAIPAAIVAATASATAESPETPGTTSTTTATMQKWVGGRVLHWKGLRP
jgi:hypothetical protein